MAAQTATLDRERLDAVIFDLDGVLTDTARVHAAAWKRMFDGFLEDRARATGEPFRPFEDEDYQRHVDGKPRHDGIVAFLEARGIELPFGEPGDSMHRETVCGLANRKNLLFQQHLSEHGVERFESSVALVQALREAGIKVAVISASRNCRHVLEAAGIRDLFEVRVDGEDARELRLPGKPDPAIFLEAAKRLDVAPGRAAVVEDAIAGVEAASRGGFGLVVGVNRAGEAGTLLAHGADVEVRDLGALRLAGADDDLPDALERFDDIRARLEGREWPVFLDYDGTLTPIVPDPDRAVLDEAMRATLEQLAERVCVGIITGRDLEKIKQLVGVGGVVYAASHGFDIEGSKKRPFRHETGSEFLPDLDRAEAELKERLAGIEGARIERKRFAITVHYRSVARSDFRGLARAVDEVAAAHPRLRKGRGKKIFELQPDIDWDKGRAVLWLRDRLGFGADACVVFIGDDVTDEDAFSVLDGAGIGIVVQDRPQPSAASYRLRDSAAVERFLARLATLAEKP